MGVNIEEKIMEALYEGCTYREIQIKCSNPSKTFIKKVIQSNNPELYSLISNNKKLKEYKNNNNKNESI